MKVNNLIKFFIVCFTIFMIFFCFFGVYTYATEEGDDDTDTIKWNSTTQFDDKHDANLDKSVRKIIGSILNVTRIIGTGLALIMLAVVAMKYMMAAPGERADIKKHAIPFVIGAIVLFGASGILTIIQNFATNIG